MRKCLFCSFRLAWSYRTVWKRNCCIFATCFYILKTILLLRKLKFCVVWLSIAQMPPHYGFGWLATASRVSGYVLARLWMNPFVFRAVVLDFFTHGLELTVDHVENHCFRVSRCTGPQQTDILVEGCQNDCNLLLYLITKHVFENFGRKNWAYRCSSTNLHTSCHQNVINSTLGCFFVPDKRLTVALSITHYMWIWSLTEYQSDDMSSVTYQAYSQVGEKATDFVYIVSKTIISKL